MEYFWWFIAAIGFFVVEILTPGFVLMWFGIGALVAGFADLAGMHSPYTQTGIFVVVSLTLVVLTKTIFKSVFTRSQPQGGLRTNMEAMIGMIGVVTEPISNDLGEGRVMVQGQDWLAKSARNETIEPQARVKILRYEGASLIVDRN